MFFDSSILGILLGMIYPTIAPALSILYVTSGIIIIRFSFWKNRKFALVIIAICFFLFIIAVTPYLSIPSKVSAIESQMKQTYGIAYSNLDTSQMRFSPFSIYDSINGISIDESKFSIMRDILWLNNGNDSFYFDWYKPKGEGPFPVIITLHGGGFILGNKGQGDEFSKYFASKGYVVFDLQYGLYKPELVADTEIGAILNNWKFLVKTQSYNQSYTIPQQLENIGNFTKMLELNRSKYSADLNKVFILGRSAGGCLASVITTGYRNSLFNGIFAASMNISGGIWFYPPTNLSSKGTSPAMDILLQGELPLELQYKKYSSSFLITNSSVVAPTMILHGDKDGLVDYQTQSKSYYELAQELNKTCILVTIPMAGHSFDTFHSYGGQMALYYIERFMALELGG